MLADTNPRTRHGSQVRSDAPLSSGNRGYEGTHERFPGFYIFDHGFEFDALALAARGRAL